MMKLFGEELVWPEPKRSDHEIGSSEPRWLTGLPWML